jgi:hypothetical protein
MKPAAATPPNDFSHVLRFSTNMYLQLLKRNSAAKREITAKKYFKRKRSTVSRIERDAAASG